MSTEDSGTLPDTHPQCQYMVPRKKRLCRMTVRPGRRYCGEHDRPDPTVNTSAVGAEGDARVACPLDPKHTCYASKLEKHLKVCNARCDTTPPYIRLGCNSVTPSSPQDTDRIRLKDVPTDKLKIVVDLVEKLYHELVSNSIEHRVEPDSSPVHPSVQEDYILEERRHSSRRHLRQTSSLLRAVEREGLGGENTCFVELGAGKGHVSYYLARALEGTPSCSVLLVDRASHRHKQDNKLDPSQHRVQRLRADINDLLLSEVEDVRTSDSLVAVSKHLCGVATDYALRCVTASSIVNKTRGVVMATCCHHRCTAGGYVAWDFLKEKGITVEYFDIIMGIVSWATCGTGYSRERTQENNDNKRQKSDNNCQTQHTDIVNNGKENDNESNVKSDSVINTSCEEKTVISNDSNPKKKLESKEKDVERNTTDVEVKLSDVKTELTDVRGLGLTESNEKDVESNTADIEVKLSGVKTELADVRGLGLTVERRTEIGRHAKALLDYGRTVFLRSCGFEAKLCYYVDVDVSPENVCIIAKK